MLLKPWELGSSWGAEQLHSTGESWDFILCNTKRIRKSWEWVTLGTTWILERGPATGIQVYQMAIGHERRGGHSPPEVVVPCAPEWNCKLQNQIMSVFSVSAKSQKNTVSLSNTSSQMHWLKKDMQSWLRERSKQLSNLRQAQKLHKAKTTETTFLLGVSSRKHGVDQVVLWSLHASNLF